MGHSREKTLTGSDTRTPATHSRSVALALARLRGVVWLCCWVVALGLLVQTIVWGLTVFTDLRWTEVAADKSAPAPMVVTPKQAQPPRLRSALDGPLAESEAEAVNPNRILGPRDRTLSMTASLAGGFGSLAVAALIPLVGLGAIVAATSATNGVEKTVSAFSWTLLVALFALPFGELMGFPWQDGAFWSYERLCERLDARTTTSIDLVFCSRYLALPLVTGCGIAVIALRFSGGVDAGAYRGEQLRVDPALEKEAGNIKPSTLHGGRAASAMRNAMMKDAIARPGVASLSTSSVKQPSAGTAPKRLI